MSQCRRGVCGKRSGHDEIVLFSPSGSMPDARHSAMRQLLQRCRRTANFDFIEFLSKQSNEHTFESCSSSTNEYMAMGRFWNSPYESKKRSAFKMLWNGQKYNSDRFTRRFLNLSSKTFHHSSNTYSKVLYFYTHNSPADCLRLACICTLYWLRWTDGRRSGNRCRKQTKSR